MAGRQRSSGEEPRFRRAPVLSSREFEDLGRRLIVINSVSEFLEVDAHTCLRDRARATDGAPARLFTARLRGIAPRRRRRLVPSLSTAAFLVAAAAPVAFLSTRNPRYAVEGMLRRLLAFGGAVAASFYPSAFLGSYCTDILGSFQLFLPSFLTSSTPLRRPSMASGCGACAARMWAINTTTSYS